MPANTPARQQIQPENRRRRATSPFTVSQTQCSLLISMVIFPWIIRSVSHVARSMFERRCVGWFGKMNYLILSATNIYYFHFGYCSGTLRFEAILSLAWIPICRPIQRALWIIWYLFSLYFVAQTKINGDPLNSFWFISRNSVELPTRCSCPVWSLTFDVNAHVTDIFVCIRLLCRS